MAVRSVTTSVGSIGGYGVVNADGNVADSDCGVMTVVMVVTLVMLQSMETSCGSLKRSPIDKMWLNNYS